ncbi:major facilitator superfamily domain-containing protein 1-like [Physella acuta]|uniref:major facilitator superfamily domain-containing protein 1-like n=1 Tax=Physella acuta TaxID=109671 RepID=UPI0027DAD7DD|nr:major facilitator superfamily domain-containing protein 1-like [Physella acuta]
MGDTDTDKVAETKLDKSNFTCQDSGQDDDEIGGKKSCDLCNPRHWLHRYFPVLILLCFLLFGSYFVNDIPGSLQDVMVRDLDLSETEFMAFYAFEAWPNVVLCIVGGYMIDGLFGVRLGAIVFSVLVTLGQAMFALGGFINNYVLMCCGRFVLGIGEESLGIAQSTFATKWFKEKELNMVFGLLLSFSRLASTVAMNVMQPLYNLVDQAVHGYKGLGITLFIAVFVCFMSALCAVILSFFDKRADKILSRSKVESDEKIKLKDILKIPMMTWIMTFICVTFYVGVMPFISLGLVFFVMKFGLTPATASTLNSLVYIIPAVACPLLGFCIDKTGKNIFWVIGGISLALVSHMMLAFTFVNPYIPMVVLGFSYSVLASSIWPLVAFVVPNKQLGTAYGIMQAFLNLGLGVCFILAGLVLDKFGYLILEIFFLAWLCLCLIAAILLYLVDLNKGGHLNLSTKERALQKKKQKEMEKLKQLNEDQNESAKTDIDVADITE